MPISKYNKKYLAEKLGFEIDDKTLFRNMGNMGLSIERATKDEIDVEFWNRPDLLSTVGLARAVKYFMRRSREFDYKVGTEESKFVINVGSHVGKIRPFIAGLVVRNMQLREEDLLEIINFTEKLSETYGVRRELMALGLHDLRDVSPPFFYDAYEDEEFIPLNRQKRMRYSEVMKGDERGRKYGALGEKEKRYVALKDARGTMSVIPIINSERTRITRTTTDMLVDITGTSKYIIEKTADLLAANFIDMGYDVSTILVDYGRGAYAIPKMEGAEITIPLEQMNKEIGVAIGFNNVILLANKMGYEASLVGTKIRFRVPTYRLDVINEQDVIEDVAVAYGYDYIQPIPVPATQVGKPQAKEEERNRIGEIMVGLGYSEMLNSYLTNEDVNFKKMRLESKDNYVTIANPKTETLTMLRTWLMPSLLKNLGQSMHDKMPISIFELDMAFDLHVNEPNEKYHLAAVTCNAGVNFNDVKAAFEGLAEKLEIKCEVKKADHKSFIEGRCAGIEVNQKNVGFLGEIHPEVLTSFGVEEPTVGFEINLDAI